MDGHWLLLEQSAETMFTRECAKRRLRAMKPDRLLEVSEALVENLISYQQIIKQAAGRIAQLESERMLADAGPFPAPSEMHHRIARDLRRSAG